MRWFHCIGVGSLARYIGKAMNKPTFSLASIMVKESFDVPAIFFYRKSAANKNKRGTTLRFAPSLNFVYGGPLYID